MLRLSGDIDAATAPDLVALMSGVRDSDLIVDVSDVTFLDSSGLSALLVARSNARADGRRLDVRNANDVVRRVLQITGLVDLLIDEAGTRPSRGVDAESDHECDRATHSA